MVEQQFSTEGLSRQLNHWRSATERLADLDLYAPQSAWNSLDHRLNARLREMFREATDLLKKALLQLRLNLRATAGAPLVSTELAAFRRRYLKTETALDFYGDAVNSRASERMARLLSGLDCLARESMRAVLAPSRRPVPLVLTYVDKGLGASILKAGLRLWEPSLLSPAAAIKIARHNLLRPTALIHETGHQVAHILGWNEELAEALRDGLAGFSEEAADVWGGWASEIAADAYAFAHAGYGSVAALHDVLAGDDTFVMRYTPGDPHPISYVRILLGVEMCRQFFGSGPWTQLAASWVSRYASAQPDCDVRQLIQVSKPALPEVVRIALKLPMRAFGGLPLAGIVDPKRVSPRSVMLLAREADRERRSSRSTGAEAIRVLASFAYRAATQPAEFEAVLAQQEHWISRLGRLRQAA